jgi:hypothetical protein
MPTSSTLATGAKELARRRGLCEETYSSLSGEPILSPFSTPVYLCDDVLACWLIGKVQFCFCPLELAQSLERVDRGISGFAVVLVVTHVGPKVPALAFTLYVLVACLEHHRLATAHLARSINQRAISVNAFWGSRARRAFSVF